MVVLAASIVSRGGKPIISRQMLEVPRSRIESLLTSFPKLIPAGSQHTTIETSEVRYVYQPMDDVWVVLITNLGSNILQDIATLSLIVRSISDLLRSAPPTEQTLLAHAFPLIATIDELLPLGFSSPHTTSEIRTILAAESHEEKVQEIIARNKEMEAKEELKRRAKALEHQRRETARMGGSRPGAGSGGYGYGSQGEGGYQAPAPVQAQPRFAPSASTSRPASAQSTKAFSGSGMKLGKKPKQSDLLNALGDEAAVSQEEYVPQPGQYGSPVVRDAYQEPEEEVEAEVAGPDVSVLGEVEKESVHVAISERLSLELLRDGGLASFDLKGELELLVSDPSLSKIKLNLIAPTESASFASDIQFKHHPNVAKFAPNGPRAIALRDAKRDFPVGKGLGVVKWKLAGTKESLVPLSINCWPSAGEGNVEVNIEFELEAKHLTLRDVCISIPIPHGLQFNITSNTGSWSHNVGNTSLDWRTDAIDADEPSGNLEFTVEGTEDVDSFFPIRVGFVSAGSLAEVQVASASLVESGEDVSFSQETVLLTEDYLVI